MQGAQENGAVARGVEVKEEFFFMITSYLYIDGNDPTGREITDSRVKRGDLLEPCP